MCIKVPIKKNVSYIYKNQNCIACMRERQHNTCLLFIATTRKKKRNIYDKNQ